MIRPQNATFPLKRRRPSKWGCWFLLDEVTFLQNHGNCRCFRQTHDIAENFASVAETHGNLRRFRTDTIVRAVFFVVVVFFERKSVHPFFFFFIFSFFPFFTFFTLFFIFFLNFSSFFNVFHFSFVFFLFFSTFSCYFIFLFFFRKRSSKSSYCKKIIMVFLRENSIFGPRWIWDRNGPFEGDPPLPFFHFFLFLELFFLFLFSCSVILLFLFSFFFLLFFFFFSPPCSFESQPWLPTSLPTSDQPVGWTKRY